jgi:hypothetical protein
MSLTEMFSEDCWATPNAVKWNRMTKRGIRNQLKATVVDGSVAYPVICKHETKRVVYPYGEHRGYVETRCVKCNAFLSAVDSTD